MRTLRQPHWQGLGRTQVIALGVVLALWLGIIVAAVAVEVLRPPPRFPPFIMEREVVRDGVFIRYNFEYRDDCNWQETVWDRVGGDPLSGPYWANTVWLTHGSLYRRVDCKIVLVEPRPRVGRITPGDWLVTEAEFADRASAVGGLVVRELDGPEVVVAIELQGERQMMRFHAETGIPLSFERISYLEQPEGVVVKSHEVVLLNVEGVNFFRRKGY